MGIDVHGYGVTIRNCDIRGFYWGIQLVQSPHCSITQNSIKDNIIGIYCNYLSGDHNITENYIQSNNTAVRIAYSNGIHIRQNKIISSMYGIAIKTYSHYTVVLENIIAANIVGITISEGCRETTVFHNTFMTNEYHVLESGTETRWDDVYFSGGNFWDNYNGVDLYHGQYQNETGSDGLGDTPYLIDEANSDHYPLMKPLGVEHDIAVQNVSTHRTILWQGIDFYVNIEIANYGFNEETIDVIIYANSTPIYECLGVILEGGRTAALSCKCSITLPLGIYKISAAADTLQGETDTSDNTFANGNVLIGMPYDANGDGVIDLKDVVLVALAFGSSLGRPTWNPNCDMNGDLKIDLKDYFVVCSNYGQRET
ncbi:MAG: NosD domain-containing protein [Candidatus Bathyarchaeota archaeon]|nr:NosD domain-containing protein [Candidatus Bathyarchaeota archaeon]